VCTLFVYCCVFRVVVACLFVCLFVCLCVVVFVCGSVLVCLHAMAQIFAAHRMFLESMTPGQPRSGLPPRDLRTEIPEPPTKKQRRQNEARADSRGHKGDRREKDPPEGPLRNVTAGWGTSPPSACISNARVGLTTTTPFFVVALAGQPPPRQYSSFHRPASSP
jgi:hypothetical protein